MADVEISVFLYECKSSYNREGLARRLEVEAFFVNGKTDIFLWENDAATYVEVDSLSLKDRENLAVEVSERLIYELIANNTIKPRDYDCETDNVIELNRERGG